jgi:two-component system, OmpR family, phosphate regulon response regulator OmpR
MHTSVAVSTILLVEDDAAAAAELSDVLSDAGATVWHAESAADARAILRQGRPQLIVLDLTLPDVDGLVFCANLKNDAPDVPFMVCSTGTTAEKILSFKLGAEDFVAKPFDAAEMQARVEAILLRRSRHAAATRGFQREHSTAPMRNSAPGPDLGRLRVDLARWRVTVDEKPLNLTPTEFQLLVFMARRPGEIISRQELARGVWGNESMSRSRTIDAYVRRISSKLAVAPHGGHTDWPPRILNIRGLGYQLTVPHTLPAA